MTYDQWKTDSGYDEGPEDECYHEEREINWEGRAECQRCGYSWWATAAEIRADEAVAASYDAYVRREMRRERLEHWFGWLAFWRRWRKPRAAEINDEIPF
jgi:hypothetical protein